MLKFCDMSESRTQIPAKINSLKVNDKTPWNSLRWKYQHKQITSTGEKMLEPIKSPFWENWT